MTGSPHAQSDVPTAAHRTRRAGGKNRWKILLYVSVGLALFLAALVLAGLKLADTAAVIKNNLQASTDLLPQFRQQLVAGKGDKTQETLSRMQSHTADARAAATEPLWRAAALLPGLGANFDAATAVAVSADDVVNRIAAPLMDDFGRLDLESLSPKDGRINLKPLLAASPAFAAAADTARLTHERLAGIDRAQLLGVVADPLNRATDSVEELSNTLTTAADTAAVLPPLLGSDGPRNYLLLIQNNAELRATGGIPGALAVLRAKNGSLTLEAQGSGSALGDFSPPLRVDAEQERIYTDRLGSFIQDVNLTPDFPTAAKTARRMWEKRNRTRIDGVIAVDPVVLANLLEKTGAVKLSEDTEAVVEGMPTTLTGRNVVKTLLSDVYTKIGNPDEQDAYFAAVAREAFGAVLSGKGSTRALLDAIGKSAEDDRIFIWSRHAKEQDLLLASNLSGSVEGTRARNFAVYFNDGTGAKMDYYVKRTVQLTRRCSSEGYSEAVVRVALSNTAPRDAGVSLPRYVTGGGVFDVRPGHVRTNVMAYGPAGGQLEGARVNGRTAAVGSLRHSERPVGVLTVDLAPGKTMVLDFAFSAVGSTAEPVMNLTPTIQKRADVVRPAVLQEKCGGFP